MIHPSTKLVKQKDLMPRSYMKRGSRLAAQKAYDHTAKGRAAIRRGHEKRYRAMKEIINRAKSRPCFDCNIQYSTWVMQFDHRDPSQKKMNISEMSGGFRGILEEIEKCDVVCANCHAERTHIKKHHLFRRIEVPSENPQGVLFPL